MRVAAAFALALGLTTTTATAYADDDAPILGVSVDAEPIPYVAFKISDVVNPSTGQPARPGERLRFQVDVDTVFEGTVEEFVRLINSLEQEYTKLGKSLREDGNILVKVLNDPERLNKQFLSDIQLRFSTLRDKVKDAIENCELLNITHLGVNVQTGVRFKPEDKVVIEQGLTMVAKHFVARVNNQQKVLCSIGYSMLAELGGAGAVAGTANPVETLKDKRDELLDRLGISRFDSKFDWATIEDIKSYAEIAADLKKLIDARQVPSPEQLQELRRKLNAQLPADLQIPDIPSIPSPTPARRMDLAVKKRKDWTGLNEGDRNRFNVYATAYYEIRGSETAQEANAEGKAGVFVFGNEINGLYGFGQFYAGPDAVRGKLMLRAFGQDVFDPLEFSESISYVKSEPELFKYGKDFEYSQQFFVGPIPVEVAAGARFKVWVGYEVAITTVELTGALIPGADASAFVRGGVGIGGFLSAGAEGQITLIWLRPKLAGLAGLRFGPEGIPFLRLGLNGDVDLQALNGKVSAYAEYPVPRFGLPPWKVKKSYIEIFSWDGFRWNHKIINWGMDVNPFGATLSGDLVDQTDREETRHLQDLLDLDQRARALVDLERQIQEKERTMFTVIGQDFQTDRNVRIPVEAEIIVARQGYATKARQDYLASLIVFASE